MPPPKSADISIDWWFSKADGKRVVAERMVDDRRHCDEAWMACGFAIEYALKAIIMKRQRFNQWPDDRKDLQTHDIRKLLAIAGIDPRSLSRPLRISFKVALDWDRAHDYNLGSMERRYARSMLDATFGEHGVVTWLKTL